MGRIENLPNWVLTNKYPAFYDSESATAVEQTAKLYGKIQELVNDYNVFVDELNNKITEFDNSNSEDYETFKTSITKLIHEFVDSIDTKVNTATTFMKDNLIKSITDVLQKMKANGELNEVLNDLVDGIEDRVVTLEKTGYKLIHDEVTESLTLVKEVSE